MNHNKAGGYFFTAWAGSVGILMPYRMMRFYVSAFLDQWWAFGELVETVTDRCGYGASLRRGIRRSSRMSMYVTIMVAALLFV